MENPIGKSGFCATPKSMQDLQDYLGKFNGEEAMIANVCAFMAWNLASKYVDEAIKASDDKATEQERVA